MEIYSFKLKSKTNSNVFVVATSEGEFILHSDIIVKYKIEKGLVKCISVEVNDIWISCHYKSGLNYWHKYKENYDKLFFNYAEAEKKLKELKGE